MAQLSQDCFASGAAILSIEDAVAAITARLGPVEEIESVDLGDADGRVLADDLVATLDLPPFTASSLGDDTLELTLATGGTVRLSAVNRDLGQLMAAFARDADRVLEVHETAGDSITIGVAGTTDDAFLARTLRAAMRAPTADELARLTPTRVDLNAPRRLWAMAR